MMTSVNCIFLRFIYDLWHRYWQLVLIVYLQDLLYPHSMSGGYIAIWPCPSVRLSVRSHFRNIYLCFYWKKWFYIWYIALAWWLVQCLPFPGLPHIYFLFTVRLTNERVGVFLARCSMQHLVFFKNKIRKYAIIRLHNLKLDTDMAHIEHL